MLKQTPLSPLRQTLEYRNAMLVIDQQPPAYSGQAFFGQQLVAQLVDANYAELVQRLRSKVDGFHQQRMAEQQGLPSAKDIRKALDTILPLLADEQVRLLKRHLHSADYSCAIDQLFNETGHAAITTLLASYAAIARRLSDAMAYIPAQSQLFDPILSILLCPTGYLSTSENSHRTLQLQPEIGQQLQQLYGY